jgi:hypothetical protein
MAALAENMENLSFKLSPMPAISKNQVESTLSINLQDIKLLNGHNLKAFQMANYR